MIRKLLCMLGRHRWFKSGRDARRCVHCGKLQKQCTSIGPRGLNYYWE